MVSCIIIIFIIIIIIIVIKSESHFSELVFNHSNMHALNKYHQTVGGTKRSVNPQFIIARESPVYHRVADNGTRRRLRSTSSPALVVPPTRRTTIGDRSFPVAGARVWNALPSFVTDSSTISAFKRHLKTYLFARSLS